MVTSRKSLPSLIPSKPGEWIKTIVVMRANPLNVCGRVTLTPVYVPDEQDGGTA
ncbi:MAG: hypothetical protein R3B91_20575 [Planctomycetaceae bacterium]